MENNISFDNLPNLVSQLGEKLESIEKLLLSRQEIKNNEERLLTIQEASDFLKITIPTIYSKVSRGELPVMKQGKRLYFSNIELLNYIKKGKRKSNAEIEAEAEQYLQNTQE